MLIIKDLLTKSTRTYAIGQEIGVHKNTARKYNAAISPAIRANWVLKC